MGERIFLGGQKLIMWVDGWMTAAERGIEFLWDLYVYNYTFVLILE